MSSPTWRGRPEPELPTPTGIGWLRVLARGIPALALIAIGLALMVVLRGLEKRLFGLRRPWTPWITVMVCRSVLFCFGIGFTRHGTAMRGAGAMVANHQSWLDIFALNASVPVVFVSKADVRSWPGIGVLARVTGTVFVERTRGQAKTQVDVIQARLAAGQCLVLFPEGTSTDGTQVLPFKSTLFAPLINGASGPHYPVQPVSVVYHGPRQGNRSTETNFYGWWGDMEFGAHLMHLLAAPAQGRVEVVYHPVQTISEAHDRKSLAHESQAVVAAGHAARRSP